MRIFFFFLTQNFRREFPESLAIRKDGYCRAFISGPVSLFYFIFLRERERKVKKKYQNRDKVDKVYIYIYIYSIYIVYSIYSR